MEKEDRLTPLELIREEADEDAATVAAVIALATAGDFDSMPSGAKHLKPNESFLRGQKKIALYFAGGALADKTFNWIIYGWRNNNGPAEYIADGTGTLGSQALVKHPRNKTTATNKFWADKLVVSNQRWIKRVASSDAAGNNECAKVFFDLCGIEYIFVGIAEADGSSGDEAGDISVYGAFVS